MEQLEIPQDGQRMRNALEARRTAESKRIAHAWAGYAGSRRAREREVEIS